MVLLSNARWAALALCAGCTFAPALADRYACGPDGLCPPGLVCAWDRTCRAAGGSAPLDLARSSVDAAGAVLSVGDMAQPASADMADPAADLASAPPVDLRPPCMRAMCAPDQCGEMLDGCGGKVTCNAKCKKDEKCGGNGPNRCGPQECQPKSCEDLGTGCGFSSDGCSQVLECGNCQA